MNINNSLDLDVGRSVGEKNGRDDNDGVDSDTDAEVGNLLCLCL